MNALRARTALLRNGGDRGDQVVSYLGIVVLVALIAVALFQLGVPGKIADAVQKQVQKPIDEGGIPGPTGSP